jgi:hypothetical protein
MSYLHPGASHSRNGTLNFLLFTKCICISLEIYSRVLNFRCHCAASVTGSEKLRSRGFYDQAEKQFLCGAILRAGNFLPSHSGQSRFSSNRYVNIATIGCPVCLQTVSLSNLTSVTLTGTSFDENGFGPLPGNFPVSVGPGATLPDFFGCEGSCYLNTYTVHGILSSLDFAIEGRTIKQQVWTGQLRLTAEALTARFPSTSVRA